MAQINPGDAAFSVTLNAPAKPFDCPDDRLDIVLPASRRQAYEQDESY
jgi:hypothetical protein